MPGGSNARDCPGPPKRCERSYYGGLLTTSMLLFLSEHLPMLSARKLNVVFLACRYDEHEHMVSCVKV